MLGKWRKNKMNVKNYSEHLDRLKTAQEAWNESKSGFAMVQFLKRNRIKVNKRLAYLIVMDFMKELPEYSLFYQAYPKEKSFVYMVDTVYLFAFGKRTRKELDAIHNMMKSDTDDIVWSVASKLKRILGCVCYEYDVNKLLERVSKLLRTGRDADSYANTIRKYIPKVEMGLCYCINVWFWSSFADLCRFVRSLYRFEKVIEISNTFARFIKGRPFSRLHYRLFGYNYWKLRRLFIKKSKYSGISTKEFMAMRNDETFVRKGNLLIPKRS
jgi:hypothetical protein